MVGPRCADVDEDRVVLGGPAAAWLRAVVIGPHDLVEECVTAEDLVEQQLAVVSFPVVDVEVQGPVWGEQLPGGEHARLQERQVVAEAVLEAEALQQRRAVASASEAD